MNASPRRIMALLHNDLSVRLTTECGSTHNGRVDAGTSDVSEALGFCFRPLDGRLVPAGGAETKGLFAFPDRQGALADGLHGLDPRNTTGARFTLRDRGGLSERDRRKLGPSGDKQRPAERISASGCAGRVL